MERLMPILLFSLPWFMAVYEIYKGLTRGEMREYLRRDYTEVDNDRPAKYCRRDKEPKTFWCLFAFYVAITILVPIGMVYALPRPADDPAPNPENGQRPSWLSPHQRCNTEIADVVGLRSIRQSKESRCSTVESCC